ncbi:feline leukemia virus subgroup C receptor-related protein 2-like isoform X1 [Acanthochromis polyacanthus]|uniref:feline leukemia virus subgroup C receptor-related protein 2-like isoform X1 n=1 Tax=Acanthochromis polyacanthus TaxID=80966 RepID=UPI002234059B|nr:feline leukemia virus subgroup C receptor-related protein 2-like isoform X1 [Acanthochromis polyacanthus]
MSSQDELSHEWMDSFGNATDNDCSQRKERTGLDEYRRPLGDDCDTLGPSFVDTAQLFPLMETKLYKRRWAMLFVFCCYSMSNAFMWLQYGIISNIFMRFYSIDSLAIDWLSMIYFLTYIPLILPVMWLLDSRGIRDVVVVGSAFNCIGAWIKMSTADPNMFAMTFFGQFVCSVATVYILGIPSRLASLWFGQQEVSTACSIGVLGNQVCLYLAAGLKKEVFGSVCMVCFADHLNEPKHRQVHIMSCQRLTSGCVNESLCSCELCFLLRQQV